MKEKVICGIQQVGIGVENVHDAFKWYIKAFGCDVKILDDQGTAKMMLPYTGGKPQDRWAILAFNLQGGGGFEIWQPMGRTLNWLSEPAKIGDLGIFCCKIKTPNIEKAFTCFQTLEGAKIVSEITTNPAHQKHFFLSDPWNNLFEIEEDDYIFVNEKKQTGASNGVIIGVSDMNKSIDFYRKMLDYDVIEYDKTDVFPDLKDVFGGERKLRRVMLKRSLPPQGPLSEIMGTSHIELVQSQDGVSRKLYENRFWGDPGFIHLCFDIRNMDAVKTDAEALGHPFVCDSGSAVFQMGDADGHFTYIEDPDGTLIEFVETFKIPILKKLKIYLHLNNKDDKKPLPRWITKSLRFLKVK